MITDKTFKKILLTLLAMLLVCSFVACEKSDPNDKYDGIFSPVDDLAWDTEHEYESYAIIVADDVSSDVYYAAQRIAGKLSENTGAHAECFYAHEEIVSGSGVCRILVGDVGFESSHKYIKKFRSEDIGYKYHDKCVYIGGITQASLLSSIERFIDDVVVYADREFFMNDGTELFLEGEYDIEEIKLLGFSLGEYTIVYPKGDGKLRAIANDFSEYILDTSGYLLTVCSDADLSAQSRVILLGDCDAFDEHKLTPEPDRVKIAAFDAGVMLVSEQPPAIKVALERLERELTAVDENGCADARIDEEIDIIFDSTDVSVLSLRAHSFALSRSDMLSIIEKVRESYPDILRFEGVSEDSVQSLFYNFNDKYELITLTDNTYHMIRKERYTYATDTANGVDVVKYMHTVRGTVFSVLELCGEYDKIKATSMLNGGTALIFSDVTISDIDGVTSAAALFEQDRVSGIDAAYFAGETLSPYAYVITDTTGFTYSYTGIKIISFN